jgi:hypothetical protein
MEFPEASVATMIMPVMGVIEPAPPMTTKFTVATINVPVRPPGVPPTSNIPGGSLKLDKN